MLVMTMQPDVALTYARAFERIAGTILGGVMAALATVCTTPLAITMALFPLGVIALSLRRVSFGLFITRLTPLVVLQSELGHPDESEVTIAAMRPLYALIGGSLAVAASLVLWPSREPDRVARDLRVAFLTHGACAAAEIDALRGRATDANVVAARRAAGVASNNLEATLQRALLEPGGGAEVLGATLTIDAALRCMAGRITALHLAESERHDPAPFLAWADWITPVAAKLAGAIPCCHRARICLRVTSRGSRCAGLLCKQRLPRVRQRGSRKPLGWRDCPCGGLDHELIQGDAG